MNPHHATSHSIFFETSTTELFQTRILMVSLLLIGAYYAALNTGLLAPPTGIGTIRLRHILCFAFPVTLILIFLTKETRFLSKQSLRRVILALSPIALMAAWFKFWPAGFEQAVSWSPLPLGQGFRIPQLSIVAVVIFLLFYRPTFK